MPGPPARWCRELGPGCRPELVNAEPYAAGWMVRLRLDDTAAAEGLMDAAAYRERIGG
jgi:glycine cleavage system H protein